MISKFMLFRQVTPVLIGSLLGVSFGTMMGWPSVAFPLLVDPEHSPIQITWDDSAILAGALMVGFNVGTAFSAVTIYGSKTGILLSFCFQIAGWMVLFCAKTPAEIGVSRALVGLGTGFGLQQLKTYTQESCSLGVSELLIKYMPLTLNVGIIFVYTVGSFVIFRVLSLTCGAIPILALLLFAVIPKDTNVANTNDIVEATETTSQNKKSFDTGKLEEKRQNVADSKLNQLSLVGVFKDKNIRKNLFWLLFFICIPQYTGSTANIVYSQVVYQTASNPYPKLCSVIYALVFLMSYTAALKYGKRYYKKVVLLGSCIVCSLLLCLLCFHFYFSSYLLEISALFAWSPLLLLSLFNLVHTLGLYIYPVLFIGDKFPENAQNAALRFYVMCSTISAVISTKIFQYLFTYHELYMAYVCLSSVGFGSAFIMFFKKLCDGQESKTNSFNNKIGLKCQTRTSHNSANQRC